MRPDVGLYSTFLQRAYDNVLHDVCLQNLPVTFALDRGGLVGADGPTHHGVFDLSYLRHIPNLVLMAPRDENELRRAMLTALQWEGPFAYRYPRGNALGLTRPETLEPFDVGKGEKLRDGCDATIFTLGTMVEPALQAAEKLAEEGISLAVVDARFVKPLDKDLLFAEAQRTGVVMTAEENALQGGFGAAVLEALADEGLNPRLLRFGIPDGFVEQGSQAELRHELKLDADGMVERIRELLLSRGGGSLQED